MNGTVIIFLKMKHLKTKIRDQKTTIGDMKNDFLSLKEYNRIQLGRVTIF